MYVKTFFIGIWRALTPTTEHEIVQILSQSKRLINEPNETFLLVNWPESLEQHQRREMLRRVGAMSKTEKLAEKIIALVLDSADKFLADLNIELYKIWRKFINNDKKHLRGVLYQVHTAELESKLEREKKGKIKEITGDLKSDNDEKEHVNDEKARALGQQMIKIELEHLEKIPFLTNEEMALCRRLLFLRFASELAAKCVHLMVGEKHEKALFSQREESSKSSAASENEKEFDPENDNGSWSIFSLIKDQLIAEIVESTEIAFLRIVRRFDQFQYSEYSGDPIINLINQFSTMEYEFREDKLTSDECEKAGKVLSKIFKKKLI